jgi:endo-1,4-beta-xylanase
MRNRTLLAGLSLTIACTGACGGGGGGTASNNLPVATGGISSTPSSGGVTNSGGNGNTSVALGGTGNANTGGAGAGGEVNTGGVSPAGGNSGTGGAATGGAAPAGGKSSTGSNALTGGKSSTGGSANTGGAATGGKSSTGSNALTGGNTPTGGAAPAGGKSSTGSGALAGGNANTGGAATGGTKATGGAATGGAATGGASATGGAKCTTENITVTENIVDTNCGYTYERWLKDDVGTAPLVVKSGGFSLTWSGIQNVVARVGLRPGSGNQVITYNANYQPNGNSYLCLYGWTTDPLVEFYVVDGWGSWRPPGGTAIGTVNSDSGTYDIYQMQQTNQPSILGHNADFPQFWSVRQQKKTSGTITLANHVSAWANKGMNMGSFFEVSMAVEGYQSSGTADVTFSMK